MLKKILITAICLLLILLLAVVLLIRHVKPTETLDLSYQEISIGSKIADIIKTRKLDVQLTEQDLNDLVKKQLSAHQQLPHDFQLDGAKLTLNGSHLEADLNLRWRDKVPIAAQMQFALAWNPPNVVIQPVRTSVKGMQLPNEWLHLEPISFSLEEHLPALIGVKNVVFQDKAVVVQLKVLR
ncbi:hypothetical protein GCM10008018_63380 [Paenibacillus marchantiophytorum]|uniref:DUF2140 family protein n=1 Tax=Paenibacillus marchantiophytorum TaxID=1619310 RepID=A0ABQ1FE85_9BACL|nr:hypothetical protein [Paenibacillus marchantiophytorum]GGA09052.1 hypothetical protein GCM10008018_63380 [Paenibacillus marchantiophytorum]